MRTTRLVTICRLAFTNRRSASHSDGKRPTCGCGRGTGAPMSLRWLPTVADIDREASPYETYGSHCGQSTWTEQPTTRRRLARFSMRSNDSIQILSKDSSMTSLPCLKTTHPLPPLRSELRCQSGLTCDLLRVKESDRLEGLYWLSPTPNIYNTLGKLLSLKMATPDLSNRWGF